MKQGTESTCLHCGNSFIVKKNTKGMFCSRVCTDGYKRARGGVLTDNGYRLIYMPEHNRSKSNGYVREHFLVAEKILGRPLLKGEVCHHIDGNSLNNSEDNIEVLPSQSAHMSKHMKMFHKENPDFRHVPPKNRSNWRDAVEVVGN